MPPKRDASGGAFDRFVSTLALPAADLFGFLDARGQAALRAGGNCRVDAAFQHAVNEFERDGAVALAVARGDATGAKRWAPAVYRGRWRGDPRAQHAVANLALLVPLLLSESSPAAAAGTTPTTPSLLLHLPNDFFADFSFLRSIVFREGQNVASVGHRWLASCPALASVDLCDLSRLASVGNEWLFDAASLTTVAFAHMDALAVVGDRWLFGCASLRAVDFTALPSLTKVGDDWLRDCARLASAEFFALRRLRTVGRYWLANCRALTTVEFERADALALVGDCWLTACGQLSSVTVNGEEAHEEDLKSVSAWLRRVMKLPPPVR